VWAHPKVIADKRMELILLTIIGSTFMLITQLFELLNFTGLTGHTAVNSRAADLMKGVAETLTVPVTVRA
jgi:hypothetical protein